MPAGPTVSALSPRAVVGLYPRALHRVLSCPTNTVLSSPASRSLSGPWLSALPSRRPRSIPTKFSRRPFRHRPAPAPAPCRMFPSWALGAPRAPPGPWSHPAHTADPVPAPCRGAGPVPSAPLPGSFIKIAPSQARPRAGSRIQMFSRCSPGPTPVARGQNVPGGWETVRGQQMEEEEEEALPQPRGASRLSTRAGDKAGGLRGAAGGSKGLSPPQSGHWSQRSPARDSRHVRSQRWRAAVAQLRLQPGWLWGPLWDPRGTPMCHSRISPMPKWDPRRAPYPK